MKKNILEKIDIFLNEAMNMNTASTLYQNIGFIINSSNIDKKIKREGT